MVHKQMPNGSGHFTVCSAHNFERQKLLSGVWLLYSVGDVKVQQ
jgi:hypothetical protein